MARQRQAQIQRHARRNSIRAGRKFDAAAMREAHRAAKVTDGRPPDRTPACKYV